MTRALMTYCLHRIPWLCTLTTANRLPKRSISPYLIDSLQNTTVDSAHASGPLVGSSKAITIFTFLRKPVLDSQVICLSGTRWILSTATIRLLRPKDIMWPSSPPTWHWSKIYCNSPFGECDACPACCSRPILDMASSTCCSYVNGSTSYILMRYTDNTKIYDSTRRSYIYHHHRSNTATLPQIIIHRYKEKSGIQD